MDGLAGRISQAAVSPCRCADSRPGATPDLGVAEPGVDGLVLRHDLVGDQGHLGKPAAATDLNNSSGTSTPEQGAAVAIWLATLPDDGPTGQQFDADGPVPW
jgi:hypothetical protein